jgi:hypothetical protein
LRDIQPLKSIPAPRSKLNLEHDIELARDTCAKLGHIGALGALDIEDLGHERKKIRLGNCHSFNARAVLRAAVLGPDLADIAAREIRHFIAPPRADRPPICTIAPY